MAANLFVSSDWFISQLVEVSLKSLLLAMAASTVLWALGLWWSGARSASVRHCVWTAVLAGMLLMPLLVPWTMAVPLAGWAYVDLPVVESADVLEQSEPPVAAATPPDAFVAPDLPIADLAEVASSFATVEAPERIDGPAPIEVVSGETGRVASAASPWAFLVAIYCLGVAVLGARLLVGLLAAWRLVRSARLIDGSKLRAAAKCVTPVFESSRVRVPITVGWWRPAILLPCDWSSWDASMLAAVLAHEQAHVRRGDLWVALAARVNATLYWFHPLAWFLSRRLTALAESACDDAVIDSLGDRTGYARHLLTVATRLAGAPRRLEPIGVAMAARPMVEQRIEAILDDRRPLARRVGWVGTMLLLVAITPAILLAAGITAESASDEAVDVGTLVVEAMEKTEERTEAGAKPQAVEEAAKPSVRGRVVMASDGSLVVGAEVKLVTWNEGRSRYDTQKTTSDDLGEFEFKHVPRGTNELVAYHGELASRKSMYKGEPVVLAADGKSYPLATLRLAPTPRIVVRVVNAADGKPVADALAHLVWSDGERDQRTDASGEATLKQLTNEVWHVEVKAKGFAQQVQAINLAGTETARVTFELAPGAALEGTVRDEVGRPLSGVGISVFPADFSGEQIEYLKTDAAGKYRFDYLPVTKGLLLMLSRDGFADMREPVTLEAATGEAVAKVMDLVLKKRPHGGTVKGIITDKDGKPIAGATIRNDGKSSSDFKTATTNENGQFTVDDVFEGSMGHELIVRAKDFAPQRVSFKPGTREEPAEVTVALAPGHRVRGRVVDALGKPIAGVRIASSDGDNSGGFNFGQTGTTDAAGRFAFDSLPADAPFDFSKRGYSEIDDQQLELNGDEEVVVTLESAAVIRGRVVDAATGEPVPVFQVAITFSPDRKEGDPGSHLSGARATSPEGESFAPADGVFVIDELVRGMPLQVTVWAEGYAKKTLRRVVAEPQERAELWAFDLTPVRQDQLFEIKGRIVDGDSRPVAAAELRLVVASKRSFPRDAYPFNWTMVKSGQVANQDGVEQFLATTSDAAGNFVFRGVQPGKDIELSYWGDGISQGRVEHLEKLTSAERGAMTIAGVTPGAVHVLIDRTVLSKVTSVMLMQHDGGRMSRASDYFSQSVSTNETEYEFRNLPPGGYRLNVHGDRTRVSAGSEMFTNKVMRHYDLEVVSGKTVTVEIDGEPTFSLPTLPKFDPAGAIVKPETRPADETTLRSESTEDAVVVRGRVTDQAGRPVAGARLWLPVSYDSTSSDYFTAEATTDERGQFALLVPRKWLEPHDSATPSTIWCYAPGKCIATANAYKQLRRGATEPITIALSPGSDTVFTVLDSDGKRLVGARVEPWHFRVYGLEIVPEKLRELIGSETDSEGRAKLFAMPREGFGTVQVSAAGYGTQQLRLRDVESEPAMRVIRLRETGRIAGQLVSDDAKAIAHVLVLVYQDDFMGEHTYGSALVHSDEAGKFVVEHFAEGPIHLILRNDDKLSLRPQIPEKIEVIAGETTEVSIPFVEGVPVRGVVRTKEGRRPVPGALVSVSYGAFRQSDQMRTDERGEFGAIVLPGPVRQQLIMRPEEFSRWTEEKAGWDDAIEVAAGKATVNLPPIELVETFERRGRLIDRAGQPVANVMFSAVKDNRRYAVATTNADGAFELHLPKTPAMETYSVELSRDEPFVEATVVSEEPLVLQLER